MREGGRNGVREGGGREGGREGELTLLRRKDTIHRADCESWPNTERRERLICRREGGRENWRQMST